MTFSNFKLELRWVGISLAEVKGDVVDRGPKEHVGAKSF